VEGLPLMWILCILIGKRQFCSLTAMAIWRHYFSFTSGKGIRNNSKRVWANYSWWILWTKRPVEATGSTIHVISTDGASTKHGRILVLFWMKLVYQTKPRAFIAWNRAKTGLPLFAEVEVVPVVRAHTISWFPETCAVAYHAHDNNSS
jgi:hypothetical protein